MSIKQYFLDQFETHYQGAIIFDPKVDKIWFEGNRIFGEIVYTYLRGIEIRSSFSSPFPDVMNRKSEINYSLNI